MFMYGSLGGSYTVVHVACAVTIAFLYIKSNLLNSVIQGDFEHTCILKHFTNVFKVSPMFKSPNVTIQAFDRKTTEIWLLC